jgi:peroxiredoxin
VNCKTTLRHSLRSASAIVGITYDAAGLQHRFTEAGNITYPFLSDINTVTMITLSILNHKYGIGDSNYGIPCPGVLIPKPDQEAVGKICRRFSDTR